jgi:hypothetical protein
VVLKDGVIPMNRFVNNVPITKINPERATTDAIFIHDLVFKTG